MPHFQESQEHSDFRKVFKKFVAKEITPFREEWDKAGIVPRDLWLKMGKQGFLCPWLPEQYGGLDVDVRYSLLIVNEELAWGDGFNVGVPLHSDVATPYLYSYGTEDLKRRLLPKTTTGEGICAVGLTEPDAGSDLASIRTSAVKDGNHYIINGQKTFITNGMSADIIMTACKVVSTTGQKGISMIVVEGDTPGLTRRKLHKMGQDGQDTAELAFEDCRVPAANLLGEEGQGFKYMMEKLAREEARGVREMPGHGGRGFQGGPGVREGAGGLRPAHRRLRAQRVQAGGDGHGGRAGPELPGNPHCRVQ